MRYRAVVSLRIIFLDRLVSREDERMKHEAISEILILEKNHEFQN